MPKLTPPDGIFKLFQFQSVTLLCLIFYYSVLNDCLFICFFFFFQVIKFVPQQEAWVIERFGKFNRILDPVSDGYKALV